jgi:y4mF family transcriptional regulator
MKSLDEFVREKRKEAGLTQPEFADRAGVALTVVRKIEQGKGNLNLEKVNRVLLMFGHTLAPVSIKNIENFFLEDRYGNTIKPPFFE